MSSRIYRISCLVRPGTRAYARVGLLRFAQVELSKAEDPIAIPDRMVQTIHGLVEYKLIGKSNLAQCLTERRRGTRRGQQGGRADSVVRRGGESRRRALNGGAMMMGWILQPDAPRPRPRPRPLPRPRPPPPPPPFPPSVASDVDAAGAGVPSPVPCP